MKILVINALDGKIALMLRERYPTAEIICAEYFGFYVGWLRSLGFKVLTLSKDLQINEKECRNVTYDLVVENPPYNISSGGSNGTGGDTTFYKRFREISLKFLNPNGRLLMVCPKGITKDLFRSPNQIELIDLMTESDYWQFNTLYFVESLTPSTRPPTISGGICAKIFCTEFNEWGFKEYSRPIRSHHPKRSLLHLEKKSRGTPPVFGMSSHSIPPAPRFICEKLTNTNFMAYDGWIDPGVCGYVDLGTLDEAEQLVTFMKNSRIPKYFGMKTKMKSQEKDFFRFSKRFDLRQIETGFEIPVEYGLTAVEIAEIDKVVSNSKKKPMKPAVPNKPGVPRKPKKNA